MVKCTPYPSLANTCWVQQVFGQTPTEARPCRGSKKPILTRYDWRILEDWKYGQQFPVRNHDIGIWHPQISMRRKRFWNPIRWVNPKSWRKLVGFSNPSEKYARSSNWIMKPQVVEMNINKKKLSCHHPEKIMGESRKNPSNWVGFPPT